MDTYDELHAVATNRKHRVSKNSERTKFPADFQDCWTGHPEASRWRQLKPDRTAAEPSCSCSKIAYWLPKFL